MCFRLRLRYRAGIVALAAIGVCYETDRPAFDTGLDIASGIAAVVVLAAVIVLGAMTRRYHSPDHEVEHLTTHEEHAPPEWPGRPARSRPDLRLIFIHVCCRACTSGINGRLACMRSTAGTTAAHWDAIARATSPSRTWPGCTGLRARTGSSASGGGPGAPAGTAPGRAGRRTARSRSCSCTSSAGGTRRQARTLSGAGQAG